MKGKSIVEYIIVDKNLQPTYYDLERHKINIWKCKVIGKFTEKKWETYNRLVAKYNKDMRHRSEYWNNHPVLSLHNTPYGYYDQEYDLDIKSAKALMKKITTLNKKNLPKFVLICTISIFLLKDVSIRSPPLKSIPKFKPFITMKIIDIIDNIPEVKKKNFLFPMKFRLGVFFINLISILKF